MKQPISITALSSISALGHDPEAIWDNYLSNEHFINEEMFGVEKALAAQLSDDTQNEIKRLEQSNSKYASLDKTVLYALYVSRKAMEQAGWFNDDQFGVNIGSSRGATGLFEKYHTAFLTTDKAATLS